VAAQILYYTGQDYDNYRRDVDYYPEGTLIWLEADVMIRQLSNGTKSLDDFCRTFHGGPGGVPDLKPYNFQDVVAGLNAVQPYDWAGFLNQRLRSIEARWAASSGQAGSSPMTEFVRISGKPWRPPENGPT
jgi:predicted metalloprotease with PDZ domain